MYYLMYSSFTIVINYIFIFIYFLVHFGVKNLSLKYLVVSVTLVYVFMNEIDH